LALSVVAVGGSAFADDEEKTEKPAPTANEQVLGLEAMCAENSEAMGARQSEKSLFERLGGEEKIHAIVAELVRLHGENEQIKRVLEGVDQDHLVKMVTQFLVVGSGGGGEYTGRNMPDAHAHLKLSNADFLAAGGDVMQAMKNEGHG
jgi:hemoglobin